MRSKSILKITLLITVLLSFSTIAKSDIWMTVNANHADWVYKVDEKVMFKVEVFEDGKLVNDVKIYYKIGPEKMTPLKNDSAILSGGQIELEGGSMAMPGFLRCEVKAVYENKNYEGLSTAAFEPEKIKPTTTLPADFNQFWKTAMAENSKIPLESKMTLLPTRCTEKVNVYEVSFQNYKIGMRVFGILCVPKAKGKYPAILKVPGAGIRAYYGDVSRAEKGIITLEIGINGISVTKDSAFYINNENLKVGALGYPSFNLNIRNDYFYKRVYLGCVRAIDFITTLPEYDGKSLAVYGASQGGALSIITAALDKRVKCFACYHPALCDLTGYMYGRAGGWPHMFSNPKTATKESLENSKYFDVVNFAKKLKVPGFFTFGFNDNACPPTTVYAAYNSVKAPKKLLIVKWTGHFRVEEQNRKVDEFLYQHLNLKY